MDSIRRGKGAGSGSGGETVQRQGTPGRRTRAMDLAQRRVAQRAFAKAADPATPSIDDVATAAIEHKAGGAPVPDGPRRAAEAQLGADLSGVRVHADDDAHASAAAIGARAFAHDRDVFLGPGENAHDVELMAHELTHVVQQGAAGPQVQRKVAVSPSDHPAEAEADVVAGRAARGDRAPGSNAIVDDSQEPQPGQMTRTQVIDAIAAAAEAEIATAPAVMQEGMRHDLAQQLAIYRSQDARTLETGLAATTGRARDAHAYVAGVREKLRAQVGAASEGAPATGGEAIAQMGASQTIDGTAAKAAGDAIGESFAGVQVHTGPAAARFAAAHEARAVAVGDHVAFGAGQYQPGTPDGDALIAHELAHVAQAKGADPNAPLARGDDHAAEEEADAAAETAVSARDRSEKKTVFRRPMALRRCDDSEKKKLEAKARALATELEALIKGAHWKGPGGIRERVYPKESAAGIQRAKDRHAHKPGAKDMTGLGSLARLDHFAAAIKAIQADWGKTGHKTVAEHKADLTAALNAEMTAVHVPEFLKIDFEGMEWKGYFLSGDWSFHLSDDLVNGASLVNKDAAELCNTCLHEARHAEQAFLSARYKAGPPDNMTDPTLLAADVKIPVKIAREAVKQKFTAATDADIAKLGKDQYQAGVTDRRVNQKISDDDGTKEMDDARREAEIALAAMKASPSVATIGDATAKRDKLKVAIHEVEVRYTAYRNIRYEADAHEVGDAAEQAFLGWPP